jgi:hypothetical protein
MAKSDDAAPKETLAVGEINIASNVEFLFE